MSQENVQLVRRIFDAWAEGDFSVGRDLVAENFEWRQPAEAVEPGSRGGEAIGGSLKRIFEVYENFTVTPEEFLDAGDQVVVVARVHGVSRGAGLALDQRFAFVWTVSDGRLARNEVFADRSQALAAAGISE